MKKVGMISLGCSKNLVDSENILGLLKDDNYEITNKVQDADIIFVNTCGFIEPSKRESIETIFEMLQYGKKVVVTGCLAQRYEEELRKEIPEVDQFIAIRNYKDFNKFLKVVDPSLKRNDGINDDFRVISTGDFSCFLKIGEGCNNCCSYCAIPLIRGGLVSRRMEDILKEAKKLEENGYKEIIVLEQDTTNYGIDLPNSENIVKLLKELLKLNFAYIRLLYLYPDEITDELIDLIASQPRLTPYFDIPIQHSETKIIKAMNRRGNKEYLTSLFNKIKNRVPNAILRTTVMVGFPGETDDDFENLRSFIKKIGFDHLGCFTYSREENTESYNFDNQIDESIKQKRLETIMKDQQSIAYKLNKKHLGEIMSGMIVGKEKDKYIFRSYWNAPDDVDGKIYVSSKKSLNPGDLVKVKITETFVYDLFAELEE